MKHQSAWDALVLPVMLGDPAVVVKRELLLLPFYGWYAARAGSIGIDRKAGAGALRRMLARARAPLPLPGGRSSSFRKEPGSPPASADPISPVPLRFIRHWLCRWFRRRSIPASIGAAAAS